MPGHPAVNADEAVDRRPVEDVVVDCFGRFGGELQLRWKAVVEPRFRGGVPQQPVTERGNEKGNGDIGVRLRQLHHRAALIEYTALLLPEAVDTLEAIRIKALLDAVEPLSVDLLPHIAPRNAGRFLQQNLTVGIEEAEQACREVDLQRNSRRPNRNRRCLAKDLGSLSRLQRHQPRRPRRCSCGVSGPDHYMNDVWRANSDPYGFRAIANHDARTCLFDSDGCSDSGCTRFGFEIDLRQQRTRSRNCRSCQKPTAIEGFSHDTSWSPLLQPHSRQECLISGRRSKGDLEGESRARSRPPAGNASACRAPARPAGSGCATSSRVLPE